MRHLKPVLLTVAFLCVASAFGAYKLGFELYPPGTYTEAGVYARHDSEFMARCGKARIISLVGDPTGSADWPRCRRILAHHGTTGQFMLRHNAVAVLTGLSLIALIGFVRQTMTARPPPKVVRGRQHLAGKAARQALHSLSKRECRQSGTGLEFPPGIPISRDRESRHFLIWGSTGAGKTTAMLHLMLQAIERGDKVLMLDVKGDMTSKLPRIGNIIAPHDARSLQWDIATDCQTPQEARELAARLIPESRSDRIWSDAAREILTACVISLQVRQGRGWGWADLRKLVIADADTLLSIAERYHPEAIQFLKEPGSKTTQSIISTFKAHMNVVSVLAEAWPKSSRERSFAVRDWLKHPSCHPIVLQHDGRFPQLTKAWLSGIIGLLASHAASPAMQENPERRTWLFLDEFPQLERLPHFSTLLDVGRSKGISVVLGAQDLSQIRNTYGHDQADAWIGMIGTHVVTRMNLGQSAETTSRLIGQQTVEHWRKSETRSGGHLSTSWTKEREVRPVITPSELSDRLGAFKQGVRALLIGPGEHAFEITLPYPHLTELRPASVLADWTTKPARELTPLPDAPGAGRTSFLSPEVAQRIRTSFSREHDA
ncbi:MAG: helicase HerA-like domain-containing protein [Hyphomonas sp.]|uniref:helicase HerA-like domain-containing protein n=4 Tax=Hyphomonas sp. TaxID=87 RepID=UPI0032632557